MSNTILITGSSTGIGRATAQFFQEKGWNVVATMRTPEKETELGNLENVLVTRLDVTDKDSIAAAFAAAKEQFGQVDVVLNNAGYGLMGTFESTSAEDIQRQYAVNVFGLMDVTRAALPDMRARKSGVIINVSSVGGRVTFPLISPYHSTKFAVEGFTESLSYELSQIGVKAKLVEPGGVQTDFASRSLQFRHDEKLTDYNPVVGAIMQLFEKGSMSNPEIQATPRGVAEVIWNAATDGTDQLRYVAGGDAEQYLAARNSMSDAEFMGMIKSNMGL